MTINLVIGNVLKIKMKNTKKRKTEKNEFKNEKCDVYATVAAEKSI